MVCAGSVGVSADCHEWACARAADDNEVADTNTEDRHYLRGPILRELREAERKQSVHGHGPADLLRRDGADGFAGTVQPGRHEGVETRGQHLLLLLADYFASQHNHRSDGPGGRGGQPGLPLRRRSSRCMHGDLQRRRHVQSAARDGGSGRRPRSATDTGPEARRSAAELRAAARAAACGGASNPCLPFGPGGYDYCANPAGTQPAGCECSKQTPQNKPNPKPQTNPIADAGQYLHGVVDGFGGCLQGLGNGIGSLMAGAGFFAQGDFVNAAKAWGLSPGQSIVLKGMYAEMTTPVVGQSISPYQQGVTAGERLCAYAAIPGAVKGLGTLDCGICAQPTENAARRHSLLVGQNTLPTTGWSSPRTCPSSTIDCPGQL